MTSLFAILTPPAWKNWSRIAAAILALLVVFSAPARFAAASPAAANAARRPALLMAETIIANGAVNGAVAWGDIDNDGDQDLLVTGRGEGEAMTTLLLGNDDGSLALVGSAGLPRLESSTLSLADFNHDGYLDVLITGQRGVTLAGELGFAAVYVNNGGSSFSLYQQFPDVYRGSAAWGDYDNDGSPDVLITGYQNTGEGFGALYRNERGVFARAESVAIPQVGDSAAAWGDYDADGDLDFAVIGKLGKTSLDRVAYAYQNDGAGGFTPIQLTSNGLWAGAVTWLDVDSDGYLDLLLTGNNGPDSFNREPLSLLFLTQPGGQLVQTADFGLPGVWNSTVSAGDYDNDGDPDLLINGQTTDAALTAIYTNNGGVFSDSGLALANGARAAVAWGHLDNDGSLDAVVSGVESPLGRRSAYVYTGLTDTPNTPPQPPQLAAACWDGADSLLFAWNGVSDAQTPLSQLSYSLRVGSAPGLSDIVTPPSAADGYHRLSQPGPLTNGTRAALKGLPDGEYVWSVQVIDSAFLGGPFAAEGRFVSGTHIARDDEVTVNGSEPVAIPVLANDNADYSDLTIYSLANPAHGTARVVGNAVVYTPDPDWAGVEKIRYFALSPSTGRCSAANIIVRAPGMYLEPTWVLEGKPANTLVGEFSAAPPADKPNETFTFELVCDRCQNSSQAPFWILEDKLKTTQPLNYQVKNKYTIHVNARGSRGTNYLRDFTIRVLPLSHNPPSELLLSSASIQENLSAGAWVGDLACIDPDDGDYCKFHLVNGPGGEDNDYFSITGNKLRTQAVFDYEARGSYSIRVRATDSSGLHLVKVFTIAILNVSDSPPSAILFSTTSAPEFTPPNTILGEFTAVDSDPSDAFRFTLVPGEGSADNAQFYISANRLVNYFTLDYEKQNRYTFRVRATDQTNRYVEQAFELFVSDVEEQWYYIPMVLSK